MYVGALSFSCSSFWGFISHMKSMKYIKTANKVGFLIRVLAIIALIYMSFPILAGFTMHMFSNYLSKGKKMHPFHSVMLLSAGRWC